METQEVKNIYEKDIVGKFAGDYEKNRWFNNEIQKTAYFMTLNSVDRYAVPVKFKNCLELGPGHGTWTEVLVKSHPEAKFDLVEISEEMLKLSKERFRDFNNIRYFRDDFLEFNVSDKYDFIFSSRVIEYIPNKEKVIEKVINLLCDNGEGFIITKTPKYLRNKILRRNISSFHKNQVEPKKLVNIFKKLGVKEIFVYPVTLSFPVLNSPVLNKLLYKVFGNLKLNFISKFFAESYCIKFKK